MKAAKGYVLISPCRDEATYARQTLDSIVAQSVRPEKWIIVDDGSSDETPQILAEFAQRHDWIKIVTRSNRGQRAVGPGVVDAFYAGLDTINLDDFEYLCKLDLDLVMPPTYFELVIRQMEANPRLANFSGKPYYRRKKDGKLISEYLGDENAIGAAKFYRVAAFRDIGGFVRQASWDGIDGHMCRMKGWMARSEDIPELRFIHLRPMGSSQQGIWAGRMRWGFGKYFMGSAFYYVAAVALYRVFKRPYIIGGWGILWGYLKARFARAPRFENKEFRRFLRRFELQSLLFGKRRTVNRYHRRITRSQQQPGKSVALPDSSLGSSLSSLGSSLSSPGSPGGSSLGSSAGGAVHEKPVAEPLGGRSAKKKILAVCSGGGHWVELMRLASAFEGHITVIATVDEAYRSEAGDVRFYTIRDVTRWNKFLWGQTLVKLAWIELLERPDIVISTGALPGYFSLRLAKLFGAKTIWVDSIANVKELSLSGRMIGKHADLWLTQWPHLAKSSGPSYRGTVL